MTMLAVRGPLAVASLFHHRIWTDSFHTWTISTKYNRCFRLVLSTTRSAVVPLSHVRPSSSLTALIRRKKPVRVRVASSTAPSLPQDTRKSLEVSAYPLFVVARRVRSHMVLLGIHVYCTSRSLWREKILAKFSSVLFFYAKFVGKRTVGILQVFFPLKHEATFVWYLHVPVILRRRLHDTVFMAKTNVCSPFRRSVYT